MMRLAIKEFQLGNPAYKGSTVTFYTVANGLKTATRATLYAGSTGTAQLGNPQKLDSYGKFKQAVYIEVPVIGAVEGITVPSHDTGIINPAPTFRVNAITAAVEYSFDGGVSWSASGDFFFRDRGPWAQATVYERNDMATTAGGRYISLSDHVSTASFSTDLAAGKWRLFGAVLPWFNVRDYGATGNGVTDDTVAFQAALTAAAAVFQSTITDPYGNLDFEGCEVYMPPGMYRCDLATLIQSEGVTLRGAGKLSSVITSAYDGYILRNTQPLRYNAMGMALKDFTILGDRTKANQVGIGWLRPLSCEIANVMVMNCGNDGIRLMQALKTQLLNIVSQKNVGHGLLVRQGFDEWAAPGVPNVWPSNAVVSINSQYAFNDGAGIRLTGAVYGFNSVDDVAEYNYDSSPSNTGYNIHIDCTAVVPNDFTNLWTEGPVQAHLYMNSADVGDAVRITNWRHFGNDVAGNVDRAAIVNGGALHLVNAYGHGASYKLIAGSIAPFRVNKAGAIAIIWGTNLRGSTIANNKFVEDETGATTGLFNQVRMFNNGEHYGFARHTTQFGNNGPTFRDESEAFDWMEISNFYNGIQFGDGAAAVDTTFRRVGVGQMGVMNATGAQLNFKIATALVPAVAGATITAAALIPDGAFVLGVSTRVIATLGNSTGTTGYTVGDGATANRWGTNASRLINSTTSNADAPAVTFFGGFIAANNVVLTATGGNFDAVGSVRVAVAYIDITPPQS